MWGLGKEEREAQPAVLFMNLAVGGVGCSPFLRIGPERPTRGQSELTWASKPDWDSYQAKRSNIRHRQDRAQNKGRNGNSWLQTIPLR